MDWKPAPTIMGLGWIQDQKVHISSAGLDVAKSVMRIADLERSLLFQSETLLQQLTFWVAGFFGCVVWVFLRWNTNLGTYSLPPHQKICNCLFDQNFCKK